MKSKRFILYVPIFLAIASLALVILIPMISSLFPSSHDRSEPVMIPVSPAVMERQSLNACGPYAVRAVIHMLTGKFISAEKINGEMPLRLGDKTTLPPGLYSLLATYDLQAESHWLYFNSDRSRIETLMAIIDKGHPVIMLVRDYGVQHYLTVTGYHGLYFSVYDSMMPLKHSDLRLTIDTNNDFSGNRDIPRDELLTLWSGGGAGFLFNYWCLEVFPPKQ